MDGSGEILSGTFAGRYAVERELGRGATATVYLARDTQHDRAVAIKVLRPELAASVGADRFLREIAVNESLQHPHIAPVLDSGEHDGLLFFVLPHMEGGSLRHLLRREKQLPVESAIAIARSVADALDHAHGKGLIHRDVKPENILFSSGQACLADFGIARAIERTIDESTTSTGLVRGTPAYMSPEQASGGRDYDGRSDQFSLACVLYEMLAGMPAFIGPTPEAIIAQRFQHAPRKLHVYRASISPGLEGVIERALSLTPADRFTRMADFSAALEAAPRAPTAELTTEKAGESRRWRWLSAAGAVAAIVGLIALSPAGPRLFGSGRSALDTSRVVVFPFEDAGEASGPPAHEQLHAGLRRWAGPTIVPLDEAKEALARRRLPNAPTANQARDIAKSLAAGRFVVGRVRRTPTGRAVSAEYRAVNGVTLHTAELVLPADAGQVDAVYAALADSLVLRGASDDAPPAWRGRSRNLAATQAFIAALRARDQWDLPLADSLLSRSVALDPAYSRAHLWLAEVGLWRGHAAELWVAAVDRALSDSGALLPHELLAARALSAFASGDFPRSCRTFGQIVRADSASFVGWYGLGECRRRDRVVVRDARSPSGWRPRSNYHDAVAAYIRAFELFPATYRGFEASAFGRLSDLLFTSGRKLWAGYSLTTPRREFLGALSLVGDSVRIVPYDRDTVLAGIVVPVSSGEAVARQRAAFHQIAVRWSAAFPGSAGAKEALALALEVRGENSAIDTLIAAAAISVDPDQRLRLTAARIILQVKYSIPSDPSVLRIASRSADSLLRAHPRPTTEQAMVLGSMAAVAGKCTRAAELVRKAATPAKIGSLELPADLVADAYALQAIAVLGCAQPSAVVELDRLGHRIRSSAIDASAMATAEYVLLGLTVYALFPSAAEWTARLAPLGGGFLAAAADFHAGRSDGARKRLAAMTRVREAALPGVVTPDAVLPEAALRLELRDSTAATDALDALFAATRYAPPLLREDVKDNVARVGMLIRAMALRAELGARTDPRSARLWARAVVALWSDPDSALSSLVSRMNVLAQ